MSASGVDAQARARVEGDLAAAIALEAGAGTGKTTALVARVVALLRQGTELRRMAVVTFLRAAAEEMRVRLRLELAREEAEWARAAEAQLPGAAIGTIHSFAQRLLAQEAEAAEWDPATHVLEEDEARALARHHFRRWLERAAADDPAPLLALRDLGLTVGARTLFELATGLSPDAYPPPMPPTVPQAAADELEGRIREALTAFERLSPACRTEADAALGAGPKLAAALGELAMWGGPERVAAACRLELPVPNLGSQANWQPKEALRELKDVLRALRAAQGELRARAGERAAAALLRWLAPYPAFAAAERQAMGVATFDDLLRRAVGLLESDTEAQRRTAERYSAVLVDEFQDTDPLQARLLRLIAGPPQPAPAGAVARLFVVGDPKQAIYRFRGADLETYIEFTQRFPADGRLPLVDNHRARTPLLELPNRVCPPLMAEGPVPYRALVGGRGPAAADAPAPIQVLVPGGAPEAADLEGTRRIEAELVAAHLRAALDAPWRVEGHALEAGDVALLFRTRTAYPPYAQALERFGIPHGAERDKGIWRAGVARDAARLLLAVAQPHSPIAVAAALRTALVGASDEDLWRFAQLGGRFDLEAPVPAYAPSVLARAIEALRDAALARAELPNQRLLALIERLDLAGAAVLGEGEAGARALSRVLETVRSLEERRPGGMGDMADVAAALAGVGMAAGDDDAVPDPAPAADPLPTGGVVRFLTVHEAKGNQFPVVVLCDLWGGPPSERAHLYASARDARAGLWLRTPWGEPAAESPGTAELRAADRLAAQAERVRLLYVALTRAREVVVVPDAPVKAAAAESVGGLIRRAAGLEKGPGVADALEALGVEHVRAVPAAEPVPRPERLPAAALAEGPGDLWAMREALRARAGATPIVRPSGAESDGTLPGADTAPGSWVDRERARRLGVAVHTVFAQALGERQVDLPSLAVAAAGHEGLAASDGEEVLDLARAALAHPLVRRAREAPRRTVEAPVSARTSTGGIVLGRADLVFAEADGVVVVDLKTDRLPERSEAAAAAHARARGYDGQLALYAYALEAAMSTPVREAWVLYARGGVAVRMPAGGPADSLHEALAPDA